MAVAVDRRDEAVSMGGRRWTALGFVALAQLMVALDATIVSIALPSAQLVAAISINPGRPASSVTGQAAGGSSR